MKVFSEMLTRLIPDRNEHGTDQGMSWHLQRLTFPHFNYGMSALALRTLAARYASFKINTFIKEVYILTPLSLCIQN